MRLNKKTSALALACLGLCGMSLASFTPLAHAVDVPVVLPGGAPSPTAVDSVGTDKVVVNGVPIEAAFDSKGFLWVTARQDSGWGVKRVDLAGKKTHTYPQSTLEAESIVEGSDGNMWFTSRAHKIGRIVGDDVAYFGIPAGYGRPWHIAAGADGALWFTVSEYEEVAARQMNAIGRIDTNGAFTMYPLDQTRNVSKITAGPDGALWATAPNTDEIVRITTQGAISYFPATVDIGDNAGIVAGPDGNLWYTTGRPMHGQKTAVVRMDRNGKVLNVYSGEGIDAPMAVVAGKDGNIWFSNGFDAGTIGRIRMDGRVDAFVLPAGRLPAQWGMAHDPATGDLWTVELTSGALERYPTLGYALRLAMTGDRALDETADATKNYASTVNKKGIFFMAAPVGWPNDEPPIEAWSFNAPSEQSHYRWHLRDTGGAEGFALMNVRSDKCMVAGDKNSQKPCANADTQRFEARPTPLAGQFTLFNASLNKCADLWTGYNYASTQPRGNFHGGHYRLGGSYIGMYGCHGNYNQRFLFE